MTFVVGCCVMQMIENYINGEIVPSHSGSTLDNIEPATGAVYSRLADSDEHDVNRAVEAARDAFDGWSRTPTEERSRVLLRLADLIDANLDRLAVAESRDNGKPVSLARSVDIPRAASNFRYFATAILHTSSPAYETDSPVHAWNYTIRRPRGVAGLISPWNLPLYLFTWKIAPALATGNTAVAKPSEVTPMTAFLLSELCIEAGLPAGVLNVVHGTGPKVGAPLVAHPDVPTISFTGGTATGKAIAATAAPMFKRISLELGGKNPNIIFDDADLERAIPTSVRSSFANQGQICLCGSRMLVQRGVYDTVVEHVVNGARQLKVGDPTDPATQQGAVVSKAHLEKIARYVELARELGGTIECGGGSPRTIVNERCRDGYFFEPTIITGLDPQCAVNQEEIFGPVITITPFDKEDDAMRLANSTPYGLAASIWTSNLARAHRVADGVQSGIIWVNCWMLRDLRTSFGGMKQSGVGREGGNEALRFFTEPKNVCIADGRD